LVRLEVSPLVASNVEGNIYFQEAPLPKAGRPGSKDLIERDWNIDVRIDVIERGALIWDVNQTVASELAHLFPARARSS
jgi:hypothetical protein